MIECNESPTGVRPCGCQSTLCLHVQVAACLVGKVIFLTDPMVAFPENFYRFGCMTTDEYIQFLISEG